MTVSICIRCNTAPYAYVSMFAVHEQPSIGYNCGTYDMEGQPVLLLPYGKTSLDFKGSTIEIDHVKIGDPIATANEIDQMVELTMTGDKDVLNTFLAAARDFCKKTEEDFVEIFVLRGSWWQLMSSSPKRLMNTIYLPQKDTVVGDIQKFLKSEDLYMEMGIPWKRNYLFSGPPGVGKTTLVFGLASMLDYGICVVNFGPKTDDSAIMNALTKTEPNNILILEDIDCLFVERRANDASRSMVSFSGILNLLDGVVRKHGLITVMTTNHPERLDSALLRPGRVDQHIKFEYMKLPEVKQMYHKILPDTLLAEEDAFLEEISNLSLSPAQLQEFLFKHRDEESILPFVDELKSFCEESMKTIGTMYM
jgi:chaperone BCS1